MYTLCIRYVLDPNHAGHFRTYAQNEQPVIERCGGKIIGYWIPTDYAGPNHVGYGLIEFTSLTDYERCRKQLADDPVHKQNAEALTRSGVILSMERSFIERVNYRGTQRPHTE